ncbi:MULTISPECIES: TauD/TfdA family dioxygenase [unclassified Pseudomonas]|uniref:TauD/TfdA family dioxygenase n=1 Tax=unclassified Pseudomonas TaxID=196821 RepID=UPI0008716005|nr:MULTISPECIES: TauD/TfdA family dioxygenase [unclassified Pseudomonas]SCW88492.1 Taurine catabolism dioxygenase TauD, TfdA family [Pseudomonas sp. NFACC05-1]SCZ43886.1 Taurine catabolism dioxygenase TauD, TfdA family [Pseudomonas sp. NFACC44-2]SDA86548.1 Taurine catabolism dioxygenase TauD, TfdA family [Pseudomonas sp. NFACC51]SDX01599.1 Taurine catabolism dioxygenase TauD, TfdA family [Pseudomonas sp. NFACC08-1]SFI54532.1 Taurine catabolism dioxygenase TauD, TfdA family [Pseudomonas sp. NFA
MSTLDETLRKATALAGEATHEWLVPKAPLSTEKPLVELQLSYEEKRKLHNELRHFAIGDSASGLRQMPALGRCLEQLLAPEKSRLLRDFQHCDEVALVIRGLPVDAQLPATPYGGNPDIAELPVVAGAILAVLAVLGTCPVGYQGESEDSIFRHVSPKQQRETERSSYGSRLDLGMHVDNPHLPLSCEAVQQLSACPEYLSLTGLRCELTVPTRIVAIADVLNMLPDFVEQELLRPSFSVRRPDSFARQDTVLEQVPLLYRPSSGGLHCRYNMASISAHCEHSRLALQLFAAAANHPDVVRSVLLQPGDMLIFKNQQTLHARDGFAPRYDGLDRWMLRVFGVNDRKRLLPFSATHPFIARA